MMPLALAPAAADEPRVAEKYAQPGLFVQQGETWFFKIVDGQPASARTGLDDEKPGEDEIKVSLEGGNMIVLNGSGTAYNYQAFIAKKPGDKGNRTSVCTLIPGVTMYENWPQALPGIRLVNFTKAGDGMICA
ncbi:hypothetical protein [Novosphingobium sp.]|uniref:hypothetical protein n=1 Tax=Novosphingobium sp. TaxID=1874826 RepID=UPI003703B96E